MSELPNQNEVLSRVRAKVMEYRPELAAPVVDTVNAIQTPDPRLDRPGIDPQIKDYLGKLGPSAIEAYANKRLFHATHSTNLPRIESQGLVGDAATIDEEDLVFLDGMFKSFGSKHPQDIWNYAHYIRGERDGADRGVYFSAFGPEQVHEALKTYYGVPEKLGFFMREMDYLSKNKVGSEAEMKRAGQIFDKYYRKLTEGNPAIVTLEVDKFAPEVINLLLRNISNLEGKTILSAAIALKNVGLQPAGVNLPGPIWPENLSIADAKKFDVEAFTSQVQQNRTSYFMNHSGNSYS